MGELLAIAAELMFSLGAIFIRRGAATLDQQTGFLVVLLVNAALAAGAVTVRILWGSPMVWSLQGLAYFVLAGLLTTFLGRMLWFRAITLIGPSRTASLKATQIIFAFMVGVVVFRDHISWLAALGGVLSLTGVWILTREKADAAGVANAALWRLGVIVSLTSALLYAGGDAVRKLGMLLWAEPLVGTATGIFTGIVAFTLLPEGRERWRGLLRGGWRPGMGSFVMVGVFTLTAQWLLMIALKSIPVWVLNSILGTEPVLVPLLGLVLLRQERRGARLWAAAVVVAAGVIALVLRDTVG